MDYPAGESFHTLLSRVVSRRSQEMKVANPAISAQLGVNYRTFMYWLRGKYDFPADRLPQLCKALGNYELLDALEQEAGRVAYFPPTATEPRESNLVADVQRFIKEVGDALQVMAEALPRGTINERRFNHSIAELDDVIRECARLKHILNARRTSPEKSNTPR